MKNLEQIRALNAIAASRTFNPKGENGGAVVKKVPAMIQQNGLLGAIAFALDGNDGCRDVLQGAVEHYAQLNHKAPKELTEFVQWLVEQDSSVLRSATSEMLAYLNYYRRFAGANSKEG